MILELVAVVDELMLLHERVVRVEKRMEARLQRNATAASSPAPKTKASSKKKSKERGAQLTRGEWLRAR